VHVLAEDDDALIALHPAVHHTGHRVDELDRSPGALVVLRVQDGKRLEFACVAADPDVDESWVRPQ
jgi:hypothetical protein